MDDNGHGTHVSGIIAAAQDNHFRWRESMLMPNSACQSAGFFRQWRYGTDCKRHHLCRRPRCKVINLSLGGPYSRVMEYALKYAASKM
ncbi:S8 family serine peptidase [Bacillus licheniformis]|nr:S8 family serine peptidase [Bacillus licheniformis]